jgi:predicted transcriptional regulator
MDKEKTEGLKMRRSKIDIVVDVLEVTKNGVRKTAIVYKTNLNFRLAEKYILLLEKQGLLEKKSDIYFTSDKGKIFLGKAKDLTMQLEVPIQKVMENARQNETPMLEHKEMTKYYESPLQKSQEMMLQNKLPTEKAREKAIQCEPLIQMVG